jgi:hypothetical protein
MDEITVSLTSQNIGPVGAEEVLVSGRETMDEMVETMDEMSAVATTAIAAALRARSCPEVPGLLALHDANTSGPHSPSKSKAHHLPAQLV